MSDRFKNILMVIVGVIVIIALTNLAWFLAGTVLKILFSVLIFVVLAGLVLYLIGRYRGNRW